MKHLLNNLSSEERNRILEQYNNSLIIDTSKFNKLIESKLGDVKPLINEQTELSPEEQKLLGDISSNLYNELRFEQDPAFPNDKRKLISKVPAYEGVYKIEILPGGFGGATLVLYARKEQGGTDYEKVGSYPRLDRNNKRYAVFKVLDFFKKAPTIPYSNIKRG